MSPQPLSSNVIKTSVQKLSDVNKPTNDNQIKKLCMYVAIHVKLKIHSIVPFDIFVKN